MTAWSLHAAAGPGASRAGPRRRAAVVCGGLFALGVLLYLPSLWYGFVEYDDVRIVLDHPHLYDEHSLLRSLHEIFVGYFPREEPLLLRDVSWAINSRLFGFKNAFGYHLGNVLLNAANAPLVFLFLLRASGRFAFAATVATLFALLPVHTEAVCWVMGRKDVLCAFFTLLVLLAEAHAARAPERRRRVGLRLCGLVAYLLAILSKFSAVTLVLALLAYRVLAPTLPRSDGGATEQPPRGERLTATTVLGVLPHLGLSLAAYLAYSHDLARFGVIHGARTPLGARLVELARYLPLSIGLYLKSIFLPSDYSIVYAWPHSAIPLSAPEQAASLAVALTLALGFGWALARRRDLLFYGLAFLALMLPYFHIVDVIGWRADRYLYLSSFCVLAIVVQAAFDLARAASPALRRFLVVAAGLWALGAAALTLSIEPRFADDLALWSYEASLDRPSLMAYVSLARALVTRARGQTDAPTRQRLAAAAERVAEAGLRDFQRTPWRADAAPIRDQADLYVQLGQVAALRGEPLAAQLQHYQRSHQIAPTVGNTLFLSQVYFRMATAAGDLQLARESLRYYGEFVSGQRADAPQRAQSRQLLEGLYRRSFPALGSQIDALEAAYLR